MAITNNNKGPSLPSLSALALTAALSGGVEAKSSSSIDTARLEVQEQVGKTIIETRTGIELEALLSQTEPLLLASSEGFKGAIDFSKLQSLSAYKEMKESDKSKVREMYDLLLTSAKGDQKKLDGVRAIIINFIMFLKSVGYNPESTINKSEEFLNRTISELRKYGYGEEFVQGLETSRKIAQERDKYSMYLVSLSENEILEKIKEIEKEIAESEKKIAENRRAIAESDKRIAESDKRIAESDKRIAELKRILKNLEEVKSAMSKKVG